MGYNIDRFYITIIKTSTNEEFKKLVKNGAIPLDNNEVITIIYIFNKNAICLHNGVVYNDFKVKKHIKELLPNYNNIIKDKITIREARILFNSIYHKGLFNKSLYNNKLYDKHNFFVGPLLIKNNNPLYSKQLKEKHIKVSNDYYIYDYKLFISLPSGLYSVNINQKIDHEEFDTYYLDFIEANDDKLTIKKALQIVK